MLLERANRPDDGFYSTFVLRRASKPLTSLALRLRLTPNQISVFSLLRRAGRRRLLRRRARWRGLLAGALLMQASLVIDCVDGEVARFTRSFSDLGAWIDASSDRVKEYLAYAGLAVGSLRERPGHLAAGRARDVTADDPTRRGLRLLPGPADPGVLGGRAAVERPQRWRRGRIGCDPGAVGPDEPRQPGALGQEGPAHAHR